MQGRERITGDGEKGLNWDEEKVPMVHPGRSGPHRKDREWREDQNDVQVSGDRNGI